MAEVTITKENFEKEVLQAEKPILIDFWASWCAPCRMLAPIVEEIAAEAKDAYLVGKVNVDEQPELAAAFQISSIPLLAVVKEGKVVAQSVGYQSKEEILDLLK